MSIGTRRRFLGLGAATAAGLLVRAGRAEAHAVGAKPDEIDPVPAGVPEDSNRFFLGVASGDVSATDVWLWTRYDGEQPLRMVVWQKTGTRWRQVVRHDAPAGSRGALNIPVSHLEPATEYRYVFYVLEGGRVARRSRVGRFKTAAQATALVPVLLGATCCTMNGRDQAALEQAGRRRDLDGLILLGDTVYADGSETLAEYRKRWWENLEQPGYQALRSSTNVMATWDDHEVDNDWDPETIDPAQLEAARGAFFEHMPICRDEREPNRMWRSARYGKTVEVFILDSRGERKRSACPPEYVSDRQMQWLKDGLQKSDAMFKVIVNTVPITRFPPIFSTTKKDRWEQFPEQRDEILRFTESGSVQGVLWLSGDFHLAMIGRANATGLGSKTLEVLAGPGAQLGHPFVPWLFGRQFDWSSDENNVMTMQFDPTTERVTFAYHGKDGKKFHEAAYRRKKVGFEKVEDWLL